MGQVRSPLFPLEPTLWNLTVALQCRMTNDCTEAWLVFSTIAEFLQRDAMRPRY